MMLKTDTIEAKTDLQEVALPVNVAVGELVFQKNEISDDEILERARQILNKRAKLAEDGGKQVVNDATYLTDARGALVPLSTMKTQDIIQDEMVRREIFFAKDLNARIARFKGHSWETLSAFQTLLEQEYNAKKGGAKGNVTYTTSDGTMKIQVAMADQITFGPELQVAKKLIDECLLEWGAESHEVIRALVNRIFSVEKEGQINRQDIFNLLRLEVADERWQNAMQAIKDSIRKTGQKMYTRYYVRENPNEQWQQLTLDIASAK